MLLFHSLYYWFAMFFCFLFCARIFLHSKPQKLANVANVTLLQFKYRSCSPHKQINTEKLTMVHVPIAIWIIISAFLYLIFLSLLFIAQSIFKVNKLNRRTANEN